MVMSRLWFLLPLLLVVAVAPAPASPTITEGDLQDFDPGCSLTILDSGSIRSLTWASVAGAVSYRVGYRECSGRIVGLAEVTETSFSHTGWSPNACLQYVVVACDSSGSKICAGRAQAGPCPCP
jgi:hypothetical protein